MNWKLTFLAFCMSAVSQAQKGSSRTSSYSQEFKDNYNILKQTGSLGPYTDRRSHGISREPPESCTVDQVILYHRHGERYPEDMTGNKIKQTLHKIKAYNSSFDGGDLAFLKTWTYWMEDDCLMNQETSSGPYSGHLDALRRGAEYKQRYNHLFDQNTTYPIFTSGYQRVLETARKFGEGFFSANYTTNAAVNILSEDASAGANSLTPQCYKNADADKKKLAEAMMNPPHPIGKAASRLNSQYPGLNLTTADAFTLTSLAALELNARPTSPWIDVFTSDEWAAFNYGLDRMYFYGFGPGGITGRMIGSNFVNATLRALLNPASTNKLLFNFAHDSDIVPVVTAFDIIDFEKELPQDRIIFDRNFQLVDIVPMGGHITIERLDCGSQDYPKGKYVRMILNEAVVPIKDCQSGPGFSCPLKKFAARYSNMTSYSKGCEVPSTYPQSFTAWWNYNKTSEYNYQKTPVSCGLGQL